MCGRPGLRFILFCGRLDNFNKETGIKWVKSSFLSLALARATGMQ